MRRRIRLPAIVVCLSAAAAVLTIPDPCGSVVVSKSVRELTQEADAVVTGRVVDLASEWSADGQEIYTDVFLELESVEKGVSASSLLTVRIPGGTVGDATLVVSDTPVFEVGERALVFVRSDEEGVPRVCGWFQGKYRIRGEEAENEGIGVRRPLASLLGDIRSALR